MRTLPSAIVSLALVALACNLAGPGVTDTAPPPPAPTETAALPSLPPTASPGPPADIPDEAVLILEPGPGSRAINPLIVSGMADSTFEQNLVVRLLLDDGAELALQPTTIQSELGTRGPFRAEIPFTVTGERQAFLQVYAASPRDGGITHLASVGLRLASSGPAEIVAGRPHPEDIFLQSPAVGEALAGGTVEVIGFGRAGFEQTLVIEVYDEDGTLVGGPVPVLVESDELGQPGAFRGIVSYLVAAEGAGRVVVRDISPAFGGDAHLASVEVRLSP